MCYTVDACPLCKSTDIHLKTTFKVESEDVAIYECDCGCRFCVSFQILEILSDNPENDDKD